MRSFPDLIYVTSRASASGDTATSAAVKNCGGNDHLTKRRTWVVLGFIELVMERSRSRSFVIRDLVVYTETVVDFNAMSAHRRKNPTEPASPLAEIE